MTNILIIDDNVGYYELLSSAISHLEHHIINFCNLQDGLEEARRGTYEVILLNIRMEDGNAMELLPKLVEISSSPEVIIITDSGDPDEAELSIKNGAWDYIVRPSNVNAIRLPLVRALQYREKKISSQSSVVFKREHFEDIVGSSPALRACLELVALAAQSDANVLLSGETGTGKELFAWAIHNNSSRSNGNFVIVDCASLPESLVESTLFGHEKGAFTGADKAHDGLIKQADHGTLFLDEVGELPPSVQKSFLRVLQERSFRRVGGRQEINSDFRIIAASNRDLDEMVRYNKFRKDLLFRLRAFSIYLPPLRERPEDLKELASHQMIQFCKFYGIKEKKFSPEFFAELTKYNWPGNVRELINALERAVTAARHEPVIFPKHLPIYLRVKLARAAVVHEDKPEENSCNIDDTTESIPTLKETRESAIFDLERNYLRKVMSIAEDIQEACRISGVGRSRLYFLLKKYSLLNN